MSDKETKLNLPISLESFTRGLLSTTCLTVVCGSGAVAGTVTEPLTAFPNTSPGILLPTGTTVVNGFIGYKPSEAGFAGTITSVYSRSQACGAVRHLARWRAVRGGGPA